MNPSRFHPVAALLLSLTMAASSAGAAPQPGAPGAQLFFGMCDASAVVALNDDLFVVCDDEDNHLRVYSRAAGGMPVHKTAMSRFLGFKKDSGETDIEGAARIGDLVYWISSHGRNAKGKERPKRQRFFATTAVVRNGRIILEPAGVPYTTLLQDLTRDPRFARLDLARASQGAPKSEGALNIEGLAEAPGGQLLIGFRNPVPNDRAIVIPVLNPAEMIDGKRARFGDPILLDLGGLGIRSMTRWRDRYLILAGSPQAGGEFRLYEWSGGLDQPRWLRGLRFDGLNPEGLTPVPDEQGSEFLVVSDDGTVLCDGVECKKLKDARRKRFRVVTLVSTAFQ